MNKFEKIILLFVFFIFISIFRSWFSLQSLSTGDWIFKFPHAILISPLLPYAWDANFSNGMGNNVTFLLPLSTYAQFAPAVLFKLFHFEWIISEKIVWYFPFLGLSIFGSFIFFKKIIHNDIVLASIASLIFTTNTYVLLTVGGGQIGVGCAYALIPVVLYGFANILKNSNPKPILRNSIIAGIIYTVQLMTDPRIGYLSILLISIYYFVFIFDGNFISNFKKTILSYFVIPGVVIILLNFFWIVPFLLTGRNPLSDLGASYTSQGMVNFLSFARIENTISLLHPNWPENLFGKTYFMRPEFLLIPILAFINLFLVKTRNVFEKKVIIAFSFIGLLGIFLAKGSTVPIGNIYIWLFNNFPGFIMFRDPTKWYGLISISYMVLIPLSILFISNRLELRSKILNKELLSLLFIIVWVILIHQSFFGKLTGTFKSREIPENYIQLSDYLSQDRDYYRSLWVPSFTPFSYYSPVNPIISSNDYFKIFDNKKLVNKISLDRQQIDLSSIKYVIVPDDINNLIFVKDRKPDESSYERLVADLNKIDYLQRKKTFGKIILFEVKDSRRRFEIVSDDEYLETGNDELNYSYENPVEYKVNIKNAKSGDRLVFSENFDPRWVAIDNKLEISSEKYKNKINSFVLPRDGNYNFIIYYKAQDWVNKGLLISFVSLSIIISLIVVDLAKKPQK